MTEKTGHGASVAGPARVHSICFLVTAGGWNLSNEQIRLAWAGSRSVL